MQNPVPHCCVSWGRQNCRQRHVCSCLFLVFVSSIRLVPGEVKKTAACTLACCPDNKMFPSTGVVSPRMPSSALMLSSQVSTTFRAGSLHHMCSAICSLCPVHRRAVWRYRGIGPHTVAILFGLDVLIMIEVHLPASSMELSHLYRLAVNILPILCTLPQNKACS